VKFGAQLGVIMMLAAGLSGCETMASLDPTGLLSDDSAPAADTTTPDLAGIPAAPAVPDDQRDVANSLAAAGQQAQYSADALRAGTEAAAPAPSAAAPVSPQVAAALAAPPTASPAANDAPPSASDAPPTAAAAPIPVAGNAAPMAPAPTAQAPAAMAQAPVNPNAAVPAVPPPDSVPGRLASLAPSPAAAPAARPAAPPPGAEPAVPAVPPAGAIRSTIMTPAPVSDAALGFRASAAPPLDPSVSNFVSAPILARYKQTSGGGSGSSAMSGAVVAGGDGSVTSVIASRNGGVAPTAVVYFPGDGTTLNAAARAQIRAAVAAFKAGGGSGSVRVVGHASSRTANMPVERHLEVIFEKSQKRANAVAQELIHQGIPADHLQIDSVGDSQPIYYESMPRGEDGNRRAEIFVQG
jgi:outer membrane protein OmpA-like peptidoglycan-associated protein